MIELNYKTTEHEYLFCAKTIDIELLCKNISYLSIYIGSKIIKVGV